MHKIWEKDRLYSLLRPYVDACTRHSYNKPRVVGKLPEKGAVIIAPNHTSTLMDALVILRTRKAPTVFGARADIFAKPAIARILRFLRILPLRRLRSRQPGSCTCIRIRIARNFGRRWRNGWGCRRMS